MKSSDKVIAYKNLPAKHPIQLTAIVYLLMVHFNASDLWQGVIWTILAVFWIASIYIKFKQETVDIFAAKKEVES